MTVLIDTIAAERDARRVLREHLDEEIARLDQMLKQAQAHLPDRRVHDHPTGGTTPMNQKTDIVEQVIDRLVRASKTEIIYQAQRKGLGASAAEVAILDLVAAGKLVDTAGVLHRPVAAAA